MKSTKISLLRDAGIINEALFRISQIVLFSLYKIKNLSPEKTQIPLKKYKPIRKIVNYSFLLPCRFTSFTYARCLEISDKSFAQG